MLNMDIPTTANIWNRLKAIIGPDILHYELKQENGQRKLTRKLPHGIGLHSPPPEGEGSEIFVGRLPRDLFEDELLLPFWKIGKIFEVRLMMNFSRLTRGFAFIKYYSVTHAREAILQLNNYEIRQGHRIGVLTSRNHRNIFIGPVLDMFPYNLQETELVRLFEAQSPGVEKINLIPATIPIMFKGRILYPFKYMLVLYKTHRDAAIARRILIPQKDSLFGHLAEIDWASPELVCKVNTPGRIKCS